jgi:ABC-type branched-subunit amino acid transport system ATPase component/branched-subunit amino acid ABC-type transport system permease component
MKVFIQFAVLGLGVGAAYAILAQGIVLIYRGSGVLNFAQGAIGMFSAYVFFHLTSSGWPVVPAALVSLACGAVLGMLMQLLVMRRLRGSPPLIQTIATLGVLIVLQSVAVIIWGPSLELVTSALPRHAWQIAGITVTSDRVILLGVAVVLTVLGWWLPKVTNFGRATLAVSESERSVSALGWSPDMLAAVTWTIGGVMAAIAGTLITPFLGGLDTVTLTLVVIAGLAAALVGGLYSLPWTLAGALFIGIGQTVVPQYWSATATGQIVPFAIIVLFLVVRGKKLPTRGQSAESLPGLGSGRANLWLVAAVSVAAFALIWLLSANYNLQDAIALSGIGGILVLSMVFVLGYGGQLNLAQYSLAGIAALVAGRLSQDGWAFLPAGIVAVGATVVVGSLIAIPALRTRGITFAIVTLGLGLLASDTIFNSPSLTGGIVGVQIGSTEIFGIQIGEFLYPARFAALVLVLMLLIGISVASVRRGRVGRRLVAMRANERAAAALGMDVLELKLYAFAVSSAIAGVAGVLMAYSFATVVFEQFTPLNSIQILAFAVIGGIGYISGAIPGALLVAGGISAYIFQEIFGNSLTNWLALVGGVGVIVSLMVAPDGLAKLNADLFAQILARFRRARGSRAEAAVGEEGLAAERETAVVLEAPPDGPDGLAARDGSLAEAALAGREPAKLEIRDLTVRFGGVTAVDQLSLTVDAGLVVGLIGPNGAGKTTAIDAITGFVPPSAGQIILNGRDISRWPVHRRARLGLSRSFQSLELFDDLTVEDNIRAAADPRDRWSYLTELVWSRRAPLPPAARYAAAAFGLDRFMSYRAKDLSQGQRRLLAAARAVAVSPSILLLDEPGAGLGEDLVPEFVALVRQLAQRGTAVLLVEHDMSFVMSACDRIVVLDFGRKLAEGTPREVQADPAVIASYLGEMPADQQQQAPEEGAHSR